MREGVRLTKAQRACLEYVDSNALRGARRDFICAGHRRNVVDRLWFGGLIVPPLSSGTGLWALTPAGRAALNGENP